ncbi:MAG: FG-GAP repeat domain-containing protein [Candidatus Krumholzibacteriia bacterium]
MLFRSFTWTMLALLAYGAPLLAGNLKPRATDFAAKYEPFTLVHGPQRRLVYGSYRGTLHLMESRQGELVTALSRDLWSPVIEMLAADLDADGQDEVVGYTQDSRLFVLRGTDLGDIWNTLEGRFQSILTLTVADVDDDGDPEILMIADGLLRIFSALEDIEEWKSSEEYVSTELAVGDVDGDGHDEIVLNSGLVLGAVFRDVEWEYDAGFGTEMDLFDIDSDGIVEIVTMGGDGLIRVYDADERRLKWN